MSDSRTPSLTPSRSTTPDPPVQPDHFYGCDFPSSPSSNAKGWLDPQDDPLAQRGIPVFKPTLDEFQDFEGYMNMVECWGMRSGIVKIIPPKEWTDALPSFKSNLATVKVKNPIEQHMEGRTGLFRQQNVEKRRTMSMREWAELCRQDDFRAPSIDSIGSRSANSKHRPPRQPRPKKQTSHGETEKPKAREPQTRESKEANFAERAAQDADFLESFDLANDWLPPKTKPSDYTPEFCKELERQYWRNCGLSRSAWYGADMQGTLFGDTDTCWNVGHLPSALSRLLPSSDKGLPGVNTPYLYFGMWRATFAWHVEDMDLFSINYIHFGAPKFWYAMPQGRADKLEQTLRDYFPGDASTCPQFLRHKSFFASPTILSESSCRPNTLVQHAGEFVITFPRGYHAGFNLGLNCAESVNFALESWLDLGRKARICECVDFSVRIDVDQLLLDRELERSGGYIEEVPVAPRKRKPQESIAAPRPKRPKKAKDVKPALSLLGPKPGGGPPRITLKLGPRPKEPEDFPCCLCVSMRNEGLLPVHEPEAGRGMAHEQCANIVPETWVDVFEVGDPYPDGTRRKVRAVFGVDGIVKDRWNLKCSACTKSRNKAHGAPIQCTKGKCSKAFHVSCAREGGDQGISFDILREVEKEVILIQPTPYRMPPEGDGPPHVLKVIRKVDVQVLCSQHNPAVAEAKKAQKQDKIRNELLLLPVMSRIKIRVSAGVFEVSLLRVIDETKSVEVLWDRGVKREFKWGSVVFGSTDGQTIGQKPTELVSDAASLASQSVMSFPQPTPTPQPQLGPGYAYPYVQPPAGYYPPPGTPGYPAGSYAYPSAGTQPPAQYPNPYLYAGYAPFNPNYQGYNSNQYRSQLQWQQPYQGPAQYPQYRVGTVEGVYYQPPPPAPDQPVVSE